VAYSPYLATQKVSGSTIGASLPGSPAISAYYLGAKVITSATPSSVLPSPNTAGNLSGLISDKFGRLITLNQGTRDMINANVGGSATGFSNTTAYANVTTATVGAYSDITYLAISNTSSTQTQVYLNDGTATYIYNVPALDMVAISFSIPLKATTANVAWQAKTISSVNMVVVTVQYINNVA